jgi:predicted  nucleic acid-binding Zn-ribbon protein
MNAVTNRVSIRHEIRTRLDETRRAYVEATDRAEQLRREEMELGRRLDALERKIQNLENACEYPDDELTAEHERIKAAFRKATEGAAEAEAAVSRLNSEILAIEGDMKTVPDTTLDDILRAQQARDEAQAERDRLAALIGQQAGIDLSARESELAALKRQYGDILADEAAGTPVGAEYLTALVENIDRLESEISDARKTAERDRIRNEGLARKLAAADDKLAAAEAEFRETFRCFVTLQEQRAQLDYVKAANDLIDAYARFMQISRIQSQNRHQTTPIYGFLSLPGFNGRPLIDKATLLKLPIDPEPMLAQWRKKGLKV